MPKNEQDFLALLKEIRSQKDIDQIGELFLSIVSMYGLTMDETSAVSYYLAEQTIKTKHNKDFIAEQFNIDVDKLGVDGIQTIQRALVATYVDKVRNNDAS